MFRRLEATGVTNTSQDSGMTLSLLFSNSDRSSQIEGWWGRVTAIISLPWLESQPKLGDKQRTNASLVLTHQDANVSFLHSQGSEKTSS